MSAAKVDQILPANPVLATNIKKYLSLPAPDAKCAMKIYPCCSLPRKVTFSFKIISES